MIWQSYDHYLYALAALLGTFAAAGALLWALQRPRWRNGVGSIAGVVPPFINVLGVLFGLTLAFLANDTWNAHDRALAAVNRESDALRSITILARQLPADEAATIDGATRAYARAAIAEWPLLTHREQSVAAQQATDALLSAVAAPRIVAASGVAVSQQSLALALSVRDGRQSRIELSQTHVNPLKWAGMAVLGFLTMLSVAVVHVGTTRAMVVAVAIFALASGPTAVIVLIHGNPFQPPAAVTPLPLAAFLAGEITR